MRLLLAEDNRELAHWLEKALVQGGFAVDCVADGRAADHLLQSEQYALAVLDIGMPGYDGLEVVQRLRKRGQTLPVLLLTFVAAALLNKGTNFIFGEMTIYPSPLSWKSSTPACGRCSGAAKGRCMRCSSLVSWRIVTKAIFYSVARCCL
jgi:hypothetical protein